MWFWIVVIWGIVRYAISEWKKEERAFKEFQERVKERYGALIKEVENLTVEKHLIDAQEAYLEQKIKGWESVYSDYHAYEYYIRDTVYDEEKWRARAKEIIKELFAFHGKREVQKGIAEEMQQAEQILLNFLHKRLFRKWEMKVKFLDMEVAVNKNSDLKLLQKEIPQKFREYEQALAQITIDPTGMFVCQNEQDEPIRGLRFERVLKEISQQISGIKGTYPSTGYLSDIVDGVLKKVDVIKPLKKVKFGEADMEYVETVKQINDEDLRGISPYELGMFMREKEEVIGVFERINEELHEIGESLESIKQELYQKLKKSIDAYNENIDSLGSKVYSIVEKTSYPNYLPMGMQKYELLTNEETGMLVIDIKLPAIESLPTLKSKETLKNGNIREKHYSEREMSQLYDTLLKSIILKVQYNLYANIQEVKGIVVNGIVYGLNKATGKMREACVLSIQTKREDFEEMDITMIDPIVAFKSLKGVSAGKLADVVAVAPIVAIKSNDKRIIEGYSVIDNVEETTNLASMHWEDFENLIRDIFEREFSENGAEVKVTQASSDGGVDAIIFDPDPIRGGKIVIQAKRYTNTVGVSAVRDLYGTVMNEGAMKGILVTTSDYWPDAYEFVKNKPIQLINGANLLFLLEKHWTKAKIDIKEAKKLNNL